MTYNDISYFVKLPTGNIERYKVFQLPRDSLTKKALILNRFPIMFYGKTLLKFLGHLFVIII